MLVNYPNLPIQQLEGWLGFSRQAYYQYWQRQAGQTNGESTVIEMVEKLRQDHPKMGGRKLHDLPKEELAKKGIKMGRDVLFELLAANGLLIRKRRRRVTTTFSGHRFRKYPNLIKALVVERPNQLWVSDITYWFTNYKCLYNYQGGPAKKVVGPAGRRALVKWMVAEKRISQRGVQVAEVA